MSGLRGRSAGWFPEQRLVIEPSPHGSKKIWPPWGWAHDILIRSTDWATSPVREQVGVIEIENRGIGVYDIEDITCPRVDMNFIFEWSTRYLRERVRYRVDHEKIKFISISGHVMFCLLYKHQWNTKPFYFNIFNGLKVERVVTKHGRSTWTKTKFIW